MGLWNDAGEPAWIVLQWAATIPLGSCNNQNKICFPQTHVHNYSCVQLTVTIAHISLSMCDTHEHVHTNIRQILPCVLSKQTQSMCCSNTSLQILSTGYEGMPLYSQLLIAVLAVPDAGRIYDIVISIAHNTYFLNVNVCHFLICPER